MVTFREFLPLTSPLMVREHDVTSVLLAFALTADGELLGMIVPPGGGRATFVLLDSIEFPAPVQLRSVASGEAKLQ